jgi:hypothetical protein
MLSERQSLERIKLQSPMDSEADQGFEQWLDVELTRFEMDIEAVPETDSATDSATDSTTDSDSESTMDSEAESQINEKIVTAYLDDPETDPITGFSLKRYSNKYKQFIDLCKQSDLAFNLCKKFYQQNYRLIEHSRYRNIVNITNYSMIKTYRSPIDGKLLEEHEYSTLTYLGLCRYFGFIH